MLGAVIIISGTEILSHTCLLHYLLLAIGSLGPFIIIEFWKCQHAPDP